MPQKGGGGARAPRPFVPERTTGQPQQAGPARRPRRRPAQGPAARRSAGQPGSTRARTAASTRARQPMLSASIQVLFTSLPVPKPCSSAIGQLAYASQWTARQARVADAPAQQAGEDHREHQIERDGAEAQPERAVGAEEGDERVRQRDRREAVEHRGEDVDREEHAAPAARRCGAARRSRSAASGACSGGARPRRPARARR